MASFKTEVSFSYPALRDEADQMRRLSSHYNFPTLFKVVDALLDAAVPIVTVPGSPVAVANDTATAVTGCDVDYGNEMETVVTATIVCSAGICTVKNDVVSGVTAGEITGNASASVSLATTLAKLKLTLANAAGLTYDPNSPAVVGLKTMTITVQDANPETPAGVGVVDLNVAAA